MISVKWCSCYEANIFSSVNDSVTSYLSYVSLIFTKKKYVSMHWTVPLMSRKVEEASDAATGEFAISNECAHGRCGLQSRVKAGFHSTPPFKGRSECRYAAACVLSSYRWPRLTVISEIMFSVSLGMYACLRSTKINQHTEVCSLNVQSSLLGSACNQFMYRSLETNTATLTFTFSRQTAQQIKNVTLF